MGKLSLLINFIILISILVVGVLIHNEDTGR
jgi:hypothetical protein